MQSRTKSILKFFLAATVLTYALSAKAVTPLSALELNYYCVEAEGSSPDSAQCETYIVGFLDGAIATDERVANNVVSEIEASESFSERAIRTRLSSRMRNSGPTYYAEFCVGTPVPVSAVVEKVVGELATRENLSGVSARNLVYAALRAGYPCE